MLQFKETANPRDLQVLQDENNSLLEQMAQMKREFEDQLKEALDFNQWYANELRLHLEVPPAPAVRVS